MKKIFLTRKATFPSTQRTVENPSLQKPLLMNTENPVVEKRAAPSETQSVVSPSRRTEFSLLMNRRMAAAIHLREQLKQGHLNVKGSEFEELQELFDKISSDIEAYIHSISTHLTHLNHDTEEAFQKGPRPPREEDPSLEIPENALPITSVIHAIVSACSSFGQEAHGSAHEETIEPKPDNPSGIFTEVSQGVDKWLWFVEAHIQPKLEKP